MSEKTTYVPRAGSKAEAAIAALTRAKWLSADELASEVECTRAQIDGNIALAVQHGLIRRVARDGKAGFMLGGADTQRPDSTDDLNESAPQRRRKSNRSGRAAANAPKRPARARNGAALVTTDDPNTLLAVLEDGRIAILDCGKVQSTIAPDLALRIATMIDRLRQK